MGKFKNVAVALVVIVVVISVVIWLATDEAQRQAQRSYLGFSLPRIEGWVFRELYESESQAAKGSRIFIYSPPGKEGVVVSVYPLDGTGLPSRHNVGNECPAIINDLGVKIPVRRTMQGSTQYLVGDLNSSTGFQISSTGEQNNKLAMQIVLPSSFGLR